MTVIVFFKLCVNQKSQTYGQNMRTNINDTLHALITVSVFTMNDVTGINKV